MTHTERSQANWIMAIHAMPEIHAKLGSELDCEQVVMSALATRKYIYCKRRDCGHKNTIPIPTVRTFTCEKCCKEISITAKTNFHGAQKFKPRLMIIEFQERGITLSANQLAKLADVSTDTINSIQKRMAIAAANEIEKLAIEIPTVLCTNAIGRRTKKTPADEPPVSEEFDLQRRIQANESNFSNSRPELTELEEAVFNELSDEPKSFDQLFETTRMSASSLGAALMTLELKGCLERHTGDRFTLADNMQLSVTIFESDSSGAKSAEGVARYLVNFVKDYFQAIGRKNLQLYSVLDWFCKDRTHWPPGSLLEFCAASRQVTYEEILDYVTPLTFFVIPEPDTS